MDVRSVPPESVRLEAARIVAEHWRDGAMRRGDEPRVPWRTMAHPLALVLGALDGELDPIALGVEPDSEAAARLRALGDAHGAAA